MIELNLDTFSKSEPHIKAYTYGTHRLRVPEDTLHFISRFFPYIGITRIADVTGLDFIGLPVCMSVRPNSKSLTVSQGKGLTLPLAKVSAAMESIELFHAENLQVPIKRSTYQDLLKEGGVCDPRKLNLANPENFDENLEISWVQGHEIIQNQKLWVPIASVHTDCSIPLDGIFNLSSNGLASGNHILEAISHAVCEVVERDSSAIWNHKSQILNSPKLHIDLDTVDSDTCQEVISMVKRSGFEINIYNMTSDLKIPTFGCRIVEENRASPIHQVQSFGGYGTHLCKEIALLRAITEAVQSRVTYIAGSRDDLSRSKFKSAEFICAQKLQGEITEKIHPSYNYQSIPSLETDSFEGDIAVLLNILENEGFDQVIVVDLTKPEFEIPVVRAIIPGMIFEHDDLITNVLHDRIVKILVKEILINHVLGRK